MALLLAATLIWTAVSGQDLNWDQLNYHFYLPFNMLEGRLDTDFMAANVQSYLNPLPYFLFYWMVIYDWPSLLVASVLGVLHATNVVLSYFITKALLPREAEHRRQLALLGALLAFASPVFLMEVGTSFADISTCAIVLLGVLCALRIQPLSRWYRNAALYAGLCVGFATGLKLTNLIFCPALALMLLCSPATSKGRIQACALGATGGILGFLISHGYWSWQLWQEFGNPFFPLFNSIFASPDYPAVSLTHERFRLDSAADVLLLPLRMLDVRPWVYIETSAPDLRWVALLAASCFFLGWRYRRSNDRTATTESAGSPTTRAFFVFLVSAYLVWALASGNGRYGIAVSLLCGPALVTAVRALTAARPQGAFAARALLTALLIAQCAHMASLDLNWGKEPWAARWYQPSIPTKLLTEPYLYVTLGPQSSSYVAPFLARGSAFTNHAGQVSFDPEGPGGDRLKALFARYEGKVRMLVPAPSSIETDAQRLRRWQASADAVLLRLGFATDPADCLTITTAGNSQVPGQDFGPQDAAVRLLLTCALRKQAIDQETVAKRAEVTALFDKVVRACPQLLTPSYTVVEQTPKGWFASYINTDSALRLEDGQLFITQPRTSMPLSLGTPSQWQGAALPDPCAHLPVRLREIYNFDRPSSG